MAESTLAKIVDALNEQKDVAIPANHNRGDDLAGKVNEILAFLRDYVSVPIPDSAPSPDNDRIAQVEQEVRRLGNVTGDGGIEVVQTPDGVVISGNAVIQGGDWLDALPVVDDEALNYVLVYDADDGLVKWIGTTTGCSA